MTKVVHNASASIEVITPEEAKMYLERNENNRPLKEGVVNKYVKDMEAGNFEFNGESIIFSDHGRLLDGQHRLEAIVRSNTEQLFVVVRGVPDTAFDTIDLGKNRSVADVMHVLGTKGGAEIGGTARAVLTFLATETNIKHSGRRVLTQKEVVNFIYDNPYITYIVDKVKHNKGQLTVTPLAAVLFLANRDRHLDVKVDEFLRGIKTGENLKRGDPIYTLREWVIDRKNRYGHIDRSDMFAIVARAWSDFCKGKQLSVIKPTQVLTSKVEIYGYKQGNEKPHALDRMTPAKESAQS